MTAQKPRTKNTTTKTTITSVTNPPPMYMKSLPYEILADGHPRALRLSHNTENKKADVAEHPKVFDHIGLLFIEPPGTAELFFI